MASLDKITARITIPLTEREYRALSALAQRELRPVNMQAQRLLLDALQGERAPAELQPDHKAAVVT